MEKKVCLYSCLMPPRGLTAMDGSWPSQTFTLEAPLCKYFMKHLLRLINLRVCVCTHACMCVRVCALQKLRKAAILLPACPKKKQQKGQTEVLMTKLERAAWKIWLLQECKKNRKQRLQATAWSQDVLPGWGQGWFWVQFLGDGVHVASFHSVSGRFSLAGACFKAPA